MKKTDLHTILNAIGIKTSKSTTKTALIGIIDQSKKDLGRAINQHERHKGSYFWTPPTNSSSRRRKEKQESFEIFVGDYTYTSDVSCSCKNYYYTGTFKHMGEKAAVRAFKKALKMISI